MNPRRLLLTLLVVLAAGLLFLPALTTLLTDWWWFREIGYQVVFTRQLTTQVLLFLIVGGLTAGVFYLNLRIAQRGVVFSPVVYTIGQTQTKVNITAALRRISLPVALVSGLLAGLAATATWDVVLQALFRTPFGSVDPVFGRDIGFYVFTLPALSLLLGVLSTLAGFSLAFLLPIYFVRGDIKLRPRSLLFEPSAAMHLGAGGGGDAAAHRAPALAGGCAQPALLDHRPAGRRQLHRHARHPAGPLPLGRGRGHRRDRRPGRGQNWGVGEGGTLGDRRIPAGGVHRPGTRPAGDAEADRCSDRADPGDALPPLSHRRDSPGLGHRQRGDPGA